MANAPVHRLLELVERELEADDARLELGGAAPNDEHVLWCPLENGWRLVAIFAAPPPDRSDRQRRLEALGSTFASAAQSVPAPTQLLPAPLHGVATRRLDTELFALAARAGAVRALVIDEASPVVWGTSAPRHEGEDVDSALHAAEVAERAARDGLDLEGLLVLEPDALRAALAARPLEPELATLLGRELVLIRERLGRWGGEAWRHHLLSARAIARVRRRELDEARRSGRVRETGRDGALGYVARSFATIYVIVLVFDGRFSELHAEAALLHALPVIERLVLALPPVDPPTQGRSGALRVVR